MGFSCGPAPLGSTDQSKPQTTPPEIVGHPLMDTFVEWDAMRTNYHNPTALTTVWVYFLRERPDIHGEELWRSIARGSEKIFIG